MKVKVHETMEALGVDLAWFEAEMDITYHGSFGDNRTTPEEPAHYEMNSVRQINGPFIPPDALTEWACQWVEENHVRLLRERLKLAR